MESCPSQKLTADEDLGSSRRAHLLSSLHPACSEKIKAIIAQPEGVCGILVVNPGEGSVETWILCSDKLWKGSDTCMEWRSTKVHHGHSRLGGLVGHDPMSHTHKPTICKSLQNPREQKNKVQLISTIISQSHMILLLVLLIIISKQRSGRILGF